jgi:sorting nexin-5/6/32
MIISVVRSSTYHGIFFVVAALQLSVRGKNSKEKLSGFFKTVTQSVDEVLLSNQKDKDDFFEHQRSFLVEYFTRVKDATARADRMTKSHKS